MLTHPLPIISVPMRKAFNSSGCIWKSAPKFWHSFIRHKQVWDSDSETKWNLNTKLGSGQSSFAVGKRSAKEPGRPDFCNLNLVKPKQGRVESSRLIISAMDSVTEQVPQALWVPSLLANSAAVVICQRVDPPRWCRHISWPWARSFKSGWSLGYMM